jgi:hypothetical protein
MKDLEDKNSLSLLLGGFRLIMQFKQNALLIRASFGINFSVTSINYYNPHASSCCLPALVLAQQN